MEVDYLQPLRFLKKYSGEKYKAEGKRKTNDDKRKYSEMEKEGIKSIDILKKIAKQCSDECHLDYNSTPQWQNSGYIKKYLWLQMKYERCKDIPISISVFIELIGDKKARYRFCLEIKGKDIENKKKYHKFLDLRLPKGFVYILGSNENENIKTIEEDKHTIKEKIEKGTYEKVQLSKIQEWNDDLTNKQFEKIMLESIKTLKLYYEYVLGIKNNQDLNIENEEENVEKDIKKQFDKNVIFYGPPGTGKTYTTAKRAVEICENLVENSLIDYSEVMKKYNILKKENRIEFITFHQSYGYEEFIEGIRPVLSN